MKTCPRCKTLKSEACFNKSSSTKSGLRSWCKDCSKEDNKKREHKYRATRKEYREENKEQRRVLKQEYYKKNKEKILHDNKQWRQTLAGRKKSYTAASAKRGVAWGLTDQEFESFWKRPCFYCGKSIETIGIDRVDSSQGYHIGNTISCCSVCNTLKLDLGMLDFIEHIQLILRNLGYLAEPMGLLKVQETLERFNLKGHSDAYN